MKVNIFYAKLIPDSYFVTYLEGFYIFFNLNFDLPIPRPMANYKYTYQIWRHLDKSRDVEYQLKLRLKAYSRRYTRP